MSVAIGKLIMAMTNSKMLRVANINQANLTYPTVSVNHALGSDVTSYYLDKGGF